MKAAADAESKVHADDFWKQQQQKKVPEPDKMGSAIAQLYNSIPDHSADIRRLRQQQEQGTPINREIVPTPQPPAPSRESLNNRLRQQLKPVPINRMRVGGFPRPQPTGEPNAPQTLVQPESGIVQHQGAPQGQNVQPNAPEERQAGGGQAGGGDSTVGAAPEQNAPQITAALAENMQGRSMDLSDAEFTDPKNPHLAKVVADWNRKAATTGLARIPTALTWQKLVDSGVITATKTDAGYQVKVNTDNPGGGLSTKTPEEIAKSNAVRNAMRAQGEVLKQKEALRPKPDWRVAVTQGEAPHFQIIDPRQTESDQSPTVEAIKKAGHDVPDFSKLPQGTYTWQEAVEKLKNPETPKEAVAPVAKAQAQVSKVAATEGTRSAKEIKDELVDRIQKALADAPSIENLNARLPEDEIKAAIQKKTGAYDPKDVARIMDILKIQNPQITIDIPGDGTFTIHNTKEALTEVLARAKRLDTSAGDKKAPFKTQGISKETREEIARETAAQQPQPIPAATPDSKQLGEPVEISRSQIQPSTATGTEAIREMLARGGCRPTWFRWPTPCWTPRRYGIWTGHGSPSRSGIGFPPARWGRCSRRRTSSRWRPTRARTLSRTRCSICFTTCYRLTTARR